MPEDSRLESVLRIAAAWWVVSKKEGDEKQQKIITWSNELLKKEGFQGNSYVATEELIEEEISKVRKQYNDLSNGGKDIITKKKYNKKVEKDGRELEEQVMTGKMDNDYPTTEDEEKVAQKIKSYIGIKTPEELRRILDGSIYRRAMGVAKVDNEIVLISRLSDYSEKLERIMEDKEPDKFFVVDWITQYLTMTPEELDHLKNTIWGVSTTGISIMRTRGEEGVEDFITLPWEYFTKDISNENRMLVFPSSIDYVDELRKAGGILLQPAVNRLISSTHISSVITLQTLQRDKTYSFTVKNATAAKREIEKTGSLVDRIVEFKNFMQEIFDKGEIEHKSYIRESHVKVPTTLIYKIQAELNDDGSINWKSFKNLTEERIEEIQMEKLEAVRLASNVIDDGGKLVRESDIEKISQLEEEIKFYKKELKNLDELIK